MVRISQTVLLLCVLSLAACASTYRKSRPDLPVSERDVVELATLLGDYDQALSEKQFEVAQDMLTELENGLKIVDIQTIRHPDYRRVADAIDGAQGRLESAVRSAAIEELVLETDEILAAGRGLIETMNTDGPTDDILDRVQDIQDELAELAERGDPYRRDPQYLETHGKLSVARDALQENAKRFRWVLDATRRISETLPDLPTTQPKNSGVEPKGPAGTAQDLDERIGRADKLIQDFAACMAVAEEFTAQNDAVEDLPLRTALGALTLPQIQETCQTQHRETEDLAENLRWQQKVVAVADRVTAALQNVEAQVTPRQAMVANEEAVQTLTACATDLAQTEGSIGFDPDQTFENHMGQTSAPQLRENCTNVRDNLVALRPTLRWRIAVADLESNVEGAKQTLVEADEEEDPSDRVELLTAARDAFLQCTAEADPLLARDEEQWQDAEPNKREKRALQNRAAACKKQANHIDSLIAKVSLPNTGKPDTGTPKKGNRRKKRR